MPEHDDHNSHRDHHDHDATVRPAAPEDVPRAVRTLGRAFADYAWTRHTVAADDHVRRVEGLQELFLTRIGLAHGRVWVAGGGAAVAVWTTPATADAGAVFAELAPRFTELAGDRAQAYEEAEAALRPHRPAEPVWFLGTVGVDPDRQGAGLGRAVLRPGIEAAERDGVPAFLETSAETNLRFYERLGFEVTADLTLPGGGPRTWCMVRRVP
ncbi:GNAT family N-acetyltransferase [Streptomyces spectabilis]|uniref:Ribosomal protein S18 acetylase RimI-like enzyme n=1 Tax=Streptomyces spectabilis TaxID=68270 RepID=A0A7W8EYB3_STRST|nr:GNAT family N-acetyltransferase [Streptomyces spectabilis]MBB5107515.1 ribosomal protein S18 acetylase RimI-like enzyme [Streptomyces spectabilis]MCI3904818.1 GNAT family N-acetyltransferase [Streptomyces spectabilis]GGV02399.1 N-acetyltransferase [Streptomyces spectabilis]